MLKQKLANNETVIGSWVSLTDPTVVEILSQTGFDFLLVDGEHGPISEDVLNSTLIAAKRWNYTAVALKTGVFRSSTRVTKHLFSNGAEYNIIHEPMCF
ncbi:MAG: hypothetical protein AAF702_20510 [Chloroflexota bacterium]